MKIFARFLVVTFLFSMTSPAFASYKTLSLGATVSVPLAMGSEDAFTFYGKANRAVEFEIKRTGELRYNFRIFDSSGKTELRKRSIETDRTERIIFTPEQTGAYQVSLRGYFSYGYAVIKTRTVLDAGDPVSARTLGTGYTETNKLAEGIIRRYTFRGDPGHPLLFRFGKTGNLRYNFRILNADESTEYALRTVIEHPHEVVFTPPAKGEYVIRLTGFYDYGTYSLRMFNIFGELMKGG